MGPCDKNEGTSVGQLAVCAVGGGVSVRGAGLGADSGHSEAVNSWVVSERACVHPAETGVGPARCSRCSKGDGAMETVLGPFGRRFRPGPWVCPTSQRRGWALRASAQCDLGVGESQVCVFNTEEPRFRERPSDACPRSRCPLMKAQGWKSLFVLFCFGLQ